LKKKKLAIGGLFLFQRVAERDSRTLSRVRPIYRRVNRDGLQAARRVRGMDAPNQSLSTYPLAVAPKG